MILAVANMKGGCAKTTTAVYLAHYLDAVIVDADPQASAAGWADAVAEDGATLGVRGVVRLPDPKLAERLPYAERLVIDCSPRDHAITDAAMSAADLVVIPTAPTAADMDRTWPTLDLAARLGTPAVVVRVRTGTRSRQRPPSGPTSTGRPHQPALRAPGAQGDGPVRPSRRLSR